jgi:hypothetical protein
MDTLFNTTDPKFWGYIFLFSGIIIRYIVGSRRYKRRGAGGLQHFNVPYGFALIITLLEWCFKWLAYAAMLLGIFLIIPW